MSTMRRAEVVRSVYNVPVARGKFEAREVLYPTMNPVQVAEVERREDVRKYNNTHKGQKVDVALSTVECADVKAVFERCGGYKAFIDPSHEAAQYALQNFAVNLTIYAYKSRLRMVNSSRNVIANQDFEDVSADAYAKLRSALLEYANIDTEAQARNLALLEKRMESLSGKALYNARMEARKQRNTSPVAWYIKKINADTIEGGVAESISEEARGVVVDEDGLKTSGMIIEFNEDNNNDMSFEQFKYVCAVLVGQLYDVYLYRTGRALREVSYDTVYSSVDGTEINTVSGLLQRVDVLAEEEYKAKMDAESFMYYAKTVVDAYFVNHSADVRAEFERLCAIASNPQARMSSKEQARYYRIKTRIMEYVAEHKEELYADYFE